MANDVLLFVDSIASSPTTRLDLNVSGGWQLQSFDPGVPGMRRAVSANAMTDGGFVSSSTRDFRVVTLRLTRTSSAQDTNATSIQNLMRELDREFNYLKFQPNGATKPVFFKTYRAAPSVIDYLWSAVAHHEIELQLLADPYALGLRETISVGTVNNDPAAGSNGCYFDVTTVIGDVPAPMVMVDTGSLTTDMVLAVKQDSTASDFPVVFQGESMSFESADTANPGGAADAAMSGSATTNYARTTFATSTADTLRLTLTGSTTANKKAMRGTHRVMFAIRQASATSNMTVHTSQTVNDATVAGATVAIPSTTARQLVDLGLVTIGVGDEIDSANYPNDAVQFYAACSTGEDIHWDCAFLVPADWASCLMSLSSTFITNDLVLDGNKDAAYAVPDGTVIYSTGTGFVRQGLIAGSVPRLVPNVTNRFMYIKYTSGTPAFDKSLTGSVTLYYHPRYLFIRPSAS